METFSSLDRLELQEDHSVRMAERRTSTGTMAPTGSLRSNSKHRMECPMTSSGSRSGYRVKEPWWVHGERWLGSRQGLHTFSVTMDYPGTRIRSSSRTILPRRNDLVGQLRSMEIPSQSVTRDRISVSFSKSVACSSTRAYLRPAGFLPRRSLPRIHKKEPSLVDPSICQGINY